MTDNQQSEDHIIDLIRLQPANFIKRVVNYFTDLVAFSISFVLLLSVAGSAHVEKFTQMVENKKGDFVTNLLITLLYGLFMFAVEGVTGGKSLGKLITGTRAVENDGTRLSTKTAFWRGIVRAVPLEMLSGLLSLPSYPWHDRWTKSLVIDEKKSILPKH